MTIEVTLHKIIHGSGDETQLVKCFPTGQKPCIGSPEVHKTGYDGIHLCMWEMSFMHEGDEH